MIEDRHSCMYAIVDIETTGGKAALDKITEIGIVLHNGETIVDTYSTLINPERSIPYNIVRITGITDIMVKDAPKFYEVAAKIVKMTEGAIFVAHNVHFDYSFLQEEFRQLGYTYSRKKICTVRLSRKVFPGLPSYSLGNIIKYFSISVQARHRALDDAKATAELFDLMIKKYPDRSFLKTELSSTIKNTKLPLSFDREKINRIPDECGVYYYYNEDRKVIYIGKSRKIRARFLEHFRPTNQKAALLRKSVTEIDYILTGSDLVAQMVESEEIKKYKPEYNKTQRISKVNYAIIEDKSQAPDKGFKIIRTTGFSAQNITLGYYYSRQTAERMISSLSQKFDLCPCRLNRTNGINLCLEHQKKTCVAITDNFLSETYTHRIEQAISHLKGLQPGEKLILDQGRNSTEKTFVLCENNQIKGYGFLPLGQYLSIIAIREHLIPVKDSPEMRKILNAYIRKNKSQLNIIDLNQISFPLNF